MWNRAKRSGKQWAIVELWRLWGKLLPNGVAHHSLNRSSNFPSSLYSLLGLPALVFTHIFIYLFCIFRRFTFSHWTIQSQRIPQVRMSHDMTHEYDVCVVRKINRASFISAIPTISAISTEAFGFYITVEWTVQWTCARPCLVFKNGCKNECFEARIPIPNNPNPLKIYIVYLLLFSSRPLQLASWIHPLRHKNLLFLSVYHISHHHAKKWKLPSLSFHETQNSISRWNWPLSVVDNHNKANNDKAMRFQGNSGRWMKAEFVTGLMTSILSHTVLSNSNTNLREFVILMYLFYNNHRTYKTVRSETHIKIDVYKDVY